MEEKYMKSKKIIMITMCCLICVMAIGYAAFATNLTINGTANVTSTWKVLFTKIEEVSKTSGVTITKVPTAEGTNATFNVDLKSPGDKIIYKITVANQGTLDAIINDITASETGSDAIKFEITGIKKGDKLAKSTTTTFNVTISYDESVTSQPALTDNTLTININYVQDMSQTITPENPTITTTRLGLRILKDNTAQADTNIDFSQPSSDTNGKGLYYTNKNTEDGKTTYYFRGIVENNYVKLREAQIPTCTYKGKRLLYYNSEDDMYYTSNISESQCLSTNVCVRSEDGVFLDGVVGYDTEQSCSDNWRGELVNEKATYGLTDELWRIVRINEDGSVRLIKQDSIASSAFNENYNDAAYVGYMYGTPGSTTYAATHRNTNSSTIKTVLDTWYQNNLTSYSSIIADSGFCGDRSVAPSANTWEANDTALGYGTNYTVYGPLSRFDSNFGSDGVNPQFKCPQSNDLYTTATSTKGNKALTYPIGLITADEAFYAGGGYFANGTYYLHTGIDTWTMSPDNSDSRAFVWTVDGPGHIDHLIVDDFFNYELVVRPAINLKSTAEIIDGGNGTLNNPYVIKVN